MNSTASSVSELQGVSRVPEILAGNLIPELFATLFFAARVWSRAWLLKTWGWDDTWLSISWLGSIILCISSCLSTKYGSGHHTFDIPSEMLSPSLQLGFGSLIVYQFTIAATKISICFFYLRLFSDQTAKRCIYLTMCIILLYTIPTELFTIFQCKPVQGYWDKKVNAKCLNTLPAFYINSISNILVDIWLIIFVAPRVWKLNIAKKQKLALLTVVTFSWLVVVAAMVRVVRLSNVFRSVSASGGDQTWDFYDISIWTGLEVSMGIFCVSAPAMKPIFRRYAPGLLSLYTNKNNTYPHSHTPETYASRKQHSNPSSGHRWILKQNGIIELTEQDSDWSHGGRHTVESSWNTNEPKKGNERAFEPKSGIMKSTSVSIDVKTTQNERR